MTTPDSIPTGTMPPASRPSRPLIGPVLAGVCAVVIVIGTRQEWGHFLTFSEQGIHDDRGALTSIAAIALIVLSLVRLALPRLPDGIYYLVGGFFGGVALALPLSYIVDVLSWGKVVILGNQFEIASASTGVYVSLGGAVAYMTALVWQYTLRHGAS